MFRDYNQEHKETATLDHATAVLRLRPNAAAACRSAEAVIGALLTDVGVVLSMGGVFHLMPTHKCDVHRRVTGGTQGLFMVYDRYVNATGRIQLPGD